MQIKEAQAGTITPDMQRVADDEQISAEVLRDRIAAGHCIISRNSNHTNAIPLGVGKGLRTKVNANIGTSKDCVDVEDELKKLDIAIAAGADQAEPPSDTPFGARGYLVVDPEGYSWFFANYRPGAYWSDEPCNP